MSETTQTQDEADAQKPTVDSDPGPATCEACGDVYTKLSKTNRGVCSECWSHEHTCPECGGVKESWDDVCGDCECEHPTAYVDTSGEWDVQRCTQCDDVVNRGGVQNVPLQEDGK